MIVIPIVIRALGMIPKGLIRGLEDLEIRGMELKIEEQTPVEIKSKEADLKRIKKNYENPPNYQVKKDPQRHNGMKHQIKKNNRKDRQFNQKKSTRNYCPRKGDSEDT